MIITGIKGRTKQGNLRMRICPHAQDCPGKKVRIQCRYSRSLERNIKYLIFYRSEKQKTNLIITDYKMSLAFLRAKSQNCLKKGHIAIVNDVVNVFNEH